MSDTRYGRLIRGDATNHNLTARVDVQDGCVGITQLNADGFDAQRVLLTVTQWKEIVAFVKQPADRRRWKALSA